MLESVVPTEAASAPGLRRVNGLCEAIRKTQMRAKAALTPTTIGMGRRNLPQSVSVNFTLTFCESYDDFAKKIQQWRALSSDSEENRRQEPALPSKVVVEEFGCDREGNNDKDGANEASTLANDHF